MDTDSLIISIKTKDAYEEIVDDVEKIFETSNYEVNRPLPIGKNKKGTRLMKYGLGGKSMTESVALKPKTYSYLIDDNNTTIKKPKGTKKCVIKRILQFNDYKNILLIMKSY